MLEPRLGISTLIKLSQRFMKNSVFDEAKDFALGFVVVLYIYIYITLEEVNS